MAAASPTRHPAPASDRRSEGRSGSRRIFPAQFKLQVLEAYRRDAQCRGNQRATARKFGIHRRQIQKWLQAEPALRAALLRRAPKAASSPPPYSVGSPESARLPSPPPTAPLPTAVQLSTRMSPVAAPLAAPLPPVTEPMDLSVRRPTPPPPQSTHVPQTFATETQRKPFELFRPYLLEDECGKRPDLRMPLQTVIMSGHVSAFVPVHSSSYSPASVYHTPARWSAPLPAFPAPLR